MHVYGVPVSPFVQRVLMVARAKGHEIDLDTMPGVSLQSPEFQAISPMGRIPLLELDDGRRICESSAIAAYLDETLSGPSLLPDDAVARARVREIEAVASLEFATGLRPVMVGRVFGMPLADGVVDAAVVQAEKGCVSLGKLLDGAGKYAVGDTLTQADCLLVPVLNLAMLIDRAAGTARMIGDCPNLATYFARVADDPVAARTITEMREGFAAMMARNAAASN